jgi:hypothetical protein
VRRTVRFVVGLLLLIAVLAGAAYFFILKPTPPGGSATSTPQQAFVTLHCIGGSEKSGLLADSQVQSILRTRYQLAVQFDPMGSFDQALLPTSELKQKGIDCLWPSSVSAELVFEAKHNTADFPAYQATNILYSPEVVYAGPEGTAALMKKGIVAKRQNAYYSLNLKRLLLQYVLKRKQWQQLGTQTLQGPVKIGSTNPAESNSGYTLYLLELIVIGSPNPYQPPNAAQAARALPLVRAIYDAQGYQASTSAPGFMDWLLQGGEVSSSHLYAGYESQVLEELQNNPGQASQISSIVRLLYPQPTVYNTHPILALDSAARRFSTAMQDADIQSIAWHKYGFRATRLGVTNVKDFPQVGLAAAVPVTGLPDARVILKLQACLKNNVCR